MNLFDKEMKYDKGLRVNVRLIWDMITMKFYVNKH